MSSNALLNVLIEDLISMNGDVRRQATELLRLLTQNTVDHRTYLAGSEVAMRALMEMVSGDREDHKAAEHAIAILNHLLMNEGLRSDLAHMGVVKPIALNVSRPERSVPGRENAAGALFCLSTLDRNKAPIGIYGGIAGLVSLLKVASPRGKHDCMKALLHLLAYKGNRALAARCGASPLLLHQLSSSPTLPDAKLALSILKLMATHPEGVSAIAQNNGVPILASAIPKLPSMAAREKGVITLLRIFAEQPRLATLVEAEGGNLFACLNELSIHSTRKGRRAATALLKLCMEMEVTSMSTGEQGGKSMVSKGSSKMNLDKLLEEDEEGEVEEKWADTDQDNKGDGYGGYAEEFTEEAPQDLLQDGEDDDLIDDNDDDDDDLIANHLELNHHEDDVADNASLISSSYIEMAIESH